MRHMTLMLTCSPAVRSPARSPGKHSWLAEMCVRLVRPCLHVEQSESVVEETTGLIIGHVRRTRANKHRPLPTEEL